MNKPADSPVCRLARILAVAYLRVLAARKAAQDERNRLDVGPHNEAPCPPRRRARG
jgi:hypothetical protein